MKFIAYRLCYRGVNFIWALMMGVGKLFVIDGNDGSGKRTQAKRLVAHLEDEGIPTAIADFPQYGQKSAGLVENYLSGKYGSSSEVDPKVASVFYAVDRFDASFRIREDLKNGKFVVCNRYVSASMGHQAGKIKDRIARRAYIQWLEELEFNIFKIPRPDATVLLHVPPHVAEGLAGAKKPGEFFGRIKGDIHESDAKHLINADKAFLEVAKEKGWKIIECVRDGKILPVEEIHGMVWAEVRNTLRIVRDDKRGKGKNGQILEKSCRRSKKLTLRKIKTENHI